MCLKEIDLRAQNMLLILGSIPSQHNGGGLYDDLMNTILYIFIFA